MPIGGAEKVLVDILDNFDYKKYQVDLLLYNYEGELLNQINTNVKILYLFKPSKKNILFRIFHKILKIFKLNSLREWLRIRIIIQDQYDSIISFCQGPAHKCHTFLLNNSHNHISWIHSDLSQGNWGKLFFDNDICKQEKAYNKMSKLVFVSNDAKRAFNSIFSIRSDIEQYVIYNIIDIDKIERLAKSVKIQKNDKFLFINIGRLIDAKRQDRLIDAANILAKENHNFEVWIIGDGPLKQTLQDKITYNSLNDFVILLGGQSNPYPYLLSSDCFVLTSSQEGFPVVICEAFALGKPVISTNVVGPTELIKENSEFGLLVNQDINEIAYAMRQIMISKEIRSHYECQSKKRKRMFDKKNTMQQIFALLNDETSI